MFNYCPSIPHTRLLSSKNIAPPFTVLDVNLSMKLLISQVEIAVVFIHKITHHDSSLGFRLDLLFALFSPHPSLIIIGMKGALIVKDQHKFPAIQWFRLRLVTGWWVWCMGGLECFQLSQIDLPVVDHITLLVAINVHPFLRG